MKKLATLLLAAGMVFGAATGASAIDFKAKGQWIVDFNLGNGSTFDQDKYGYGNGEDNFEAQQRVRLQLDAVASEALSGTVYFEVGSQTWGKASNGGQVGADGREVKVKQAYIDWIVPNTDLKLRMGIQAVALPTFTMGHSQILNDDMAGVTASYAFNENVALSFVWARLLNDNYNDDAGRVVKDTNYLDNADAFALVLPLTFDGVKVTPWVMYATIGANAGTVNNTSDWNGRHGSIDNLVAGLRSYDPKKADDLYDNYSYIAAGLTGEITMADPFRFAWDFNYASLSTGDERANRQGWFGSLLAEYKMDWATPGLYAWYGSGEDGDRTNGSEKMPWITTNGGDDAFSHLANAGNQYIGRENIFGNNWAGSWGIGAQLKDMSFIEDLKHTLYVNFIMGTNDKDAVRHFGGDNVTGLKNNLSMDEYAFEFGLMNTYKVYENLTLYTDLAYLTMAQDEDLRKNAHKSYTDAWNIDVAFVYSF